MYKTIIEALQQKFPGVDAKVLEPVARKLAKSATKEEDVPTLVEGVTFQQVTESYSDFRVTQAVATASARAVSDYEERFGLKDGRRKDEPKPDDKKKEEEAEEKLESAKALAERLEALEKRLSEQDAATRQKGFQTSIASILKEKGVRESFYMPIISGRTFEDEDAAKAFAETVEQSYKDDEQALANAAHSGSRKPDKAQGDTEEDPLLKAVQEKTDRIAAEKNKQ